MTLKKPDLEILIAGLKNKDRRALAKAITLIESEALGERPLAAQILSALTKPKNQSLRLAISGPPGVGKSTFINALGYKLLARKLKVAILAVDPASLETGGSLLADKTRMVDLVDNDNIFIRPSSSRGVLGGISLALRDIIVLVSSYDFDVIIIETVGVGQSEMSAYALADFFVLLMQPGAGDSLSAMKKGTLEYADYLLVNKHDSELKSAARENYHMLKSLFKSYPLKVFLISSLSSDGIDEFINTLQQDFDKRKLAHSVQQERLKRFQSFFEVAFSEMLMPKILGIPWVHDRALAIKSELGQDQGSFLLKLEELVGDIREKLG